MAVLELLCLKLHSMEGGSWWYFYEDWRWKAIDGNDGKSILAEIRSMQSLIYFTKDTILVTGKGWLNLRNRFFTKKTFLISSHLKNLWDLSALDNPSYFTMSGSSPTDHQRAPAKNGNSRRLKNWLKSKRPFRSPKTAVDENRNPTMDTAPPPNPSMPCLLPNSNDLVLKNEVVYYNFTTGSAPDHGTLFFQHHPLVCWSCRVYGKIMSRKWRSYLY